MDRPQISEGGSINLTDEPPSSAEHQQLVRNTMALLVPSLVVAQSAVGPAVFADALITLTVRMMTEFYGAEKARLLLVRVSETTDAIALDMQPPEGSA